MKPGFEKNHLFLAIFLCFVTTLSAACTGGDPSDGSISSENARESSTLGTTASPTTPTPSGQVVLRAYSTDALLFAGNGTWSSEVASIKNILTTHGATYQAVTSAQLDAMSADDLARFGVIIFPGGAGGTEAASLSTATHDRLRQVVRQRGVGYVGFCAGAFIGQAPAPASGHDVSYGLGIVDGPVLDYYYLENQGTDIAMTLLTFPDGSTQDVLWYGGPVTPQVAGGVLAKYPDGTPAATQMWSGTGLVILSGGHPTATQSMLSALGMSSSDGIHLDLAWKYIYAALHQQLMIAF